MKTGMISPLYVRDEWPRWVKLFAKTGAPMADSYDKWLKYHDENVQKFKRDGYVVHVVEVRIDDYLSWVRTNRLPIDGHTRTDFPGHLLAERMRQHGDMDN
jgi:hypothetical protein